MREATKPDDFATLLTSTRQYLDGVGKELDEWENLYRDRPVTGETAVPALISYHGKAYAMVMGLREMGYKVYNPRLPDYAQEELLEPISDLLTKAEAFTSALTR